MNLLFSGGCAAISPLLKFLSIFYKQETLIKDDEEGSNVNKKII